jgi:hypothetical protein
MPTIDMSGCPCCDQGGDCCPDIEATHPNLTATISSSCAAINGMSGTLTWVAPSNRWEGEIGSFLDCVYVSLILKCDTTGVGCNGYRLTPANQLADGCGLDFNAPNAPDTCDCDPFTLTYDGVIVELLSGTCVCCTIGEPFTLTIAVA